MNTTTLRTAAAPAAPWWKFGYVWLVLAGPAAVIVAGIATVWIAVKSPNPIVAEDYYRQGIEINRTLEAREAARDEARLEAARRDAERGLVPAMRARNHAATPSDDLPAPAN
ncbi:MAG: FixH family protein [Burkholderiaceae bacterium]|nr:FixH family protein [Burkholderiaceae bacterium]